MQAPAHIATHTLPDADWLTAVTDLDIAVSVSGAITLYAVSRSGEMVSAYALQGTGAAQFLDRQTLTLDATAIDVLSVGGADYLMALGPTSPDPVAYRLGDLGEIEEFRPLTTTAAPEAMTGLVFTETAGAAYVYGAGLQSGAVQTFSVTATGKLDFQGATNLPQGAQRLVGVPSNAGRLLAVSEDGDNLMSLQANESGQLEQRGEAGAKLGLGLSDVSIMRTIVTDGQTLAVVAGRGSSSLSVVRVEDDGALTPLTHIIDDRTTRFQNVTAMDVVTDDRRTFVVVGGADDGLTVFELLATGRLLHTATLADSFGTALENVSAIAAHLSDGTLSVFAGSGTEEGVSQFSLGVGRTGEIRTGSAAHETLRGSPLFDVLDGAGGDDQLHGDAGDDIFLDSAGGDHFWGGTGADRFVMSLDGERDVIEDFDPGVDLLDLSGLTMLRSAAQLSFQPLANGVRITYRDEVIDVFSADGEPLSQEALAPALVIGPGLLPTGSIGAAPILPAGDGSDTITGDGGNNVIDGLGGDDDLRGGGGADVLIGGTGSDRLEGGSGADRLHGDTVDATIDAVAADIARLSQAVLGRAPEGIEALGWLGALQRDEMTLIDMAAQLAEQMTVPDGPAAAATTSILKQVYRQVRGEDPDDAVLSALAGEVEAGQRSLEEAIEDLAADTDFVANLNAIGTGLTAQSLQTEALEEVWLLLRVATGQSPDTAVALAAADEIVRGAKMSAIAVDIAGAGASGMLDDQAFVEALYENALGRAPSVAERDGWMEGLLNGLARAELLAHFATRSDVRDRHADDMETWMRAELDGDRLIAEGDDLLWGGMGADTFVFDTDVPTDARILDFEEIDRVELTGSRFPSAEEAVAALIQDGADLRLNDGSATITFADLLLGEIGADHFDFV